MPGPTSSVRPDTLDRDRFASALRESLFRKKLTQKELAHRLNVSQPTVSGWVNAQKTPGRDNLKRLVNELDLKAHEITTVQSLSNVAGPDDDALALPHISVQPKESVAETPMPASVPSEATPAANVGDTLGPPCSPPNDSGASPSSAKDISPRDKDISPRDKDTSPRDKDTSPRDKDTSPRDKDTSPRDDAFHDDPLAVLLPDSSAANSSLHVDGYVVFSRTMLRQATQTDPDELMVVSVQGNSMAPDLPDGTSAVFSRIQRSGDHGLYVVLYDNALAVKTLQRFAGGALKLTAANPSYDAEMLMPTQTNQRYRSRSTGLEVRLTVLGKVVCYVRPA